MSGLIPVFEIFNSAFGGRVKMLDGDNVFDKVQKRPRDYNIYYIVALRKVVCSVVDTNINNNSEISVKLMEKWNSIEILSRPTISKALAGNKNDWFKCDQFIFNPPIGTNLADVFVLPTKWIDACIVENGREIGKFKFCIESNKNIVVCSTGQYKDLLEKNLPNMDFYEIIKFLKGPNDSIVVSNKRVQIYEQDNVFELIASNFMHESDIAIYRGNVVICILQKTAEGKMVPIYNCVAESLLENWRF
jgi:hypothetical protein